MARQFIYHMAGLNKAYGAKKVLENVHLSFYPDAKIGILGPNGAGKSTVLKIMAGLDKEYTGEAWLAEGATLGYLEQEPKLDENKTVMENVMEGVASKTAIVDRYNELMMNYSTKRRMRARSSRTSSTARTCGTSKTRSKWRWTPCVARQVTQP